MKKIMFNDKFGLTQAVLTGRKTMTRREAKELNQPGIVSISEWGQDKRGRAMITATFDDGKTQDVYPAYNVGEVVAVAQSYLTAYQQLRHRLTQRLANLYDTENMESIAGWKNKMFVNANLMPHRIRITNVKLERLQDISEDDCLREGIYWWDDHFTFGMYNEDQEHHCQIATPYAKTAFQTLFSAVSEEGAWQRNPWVFAYEFELVK